MRSAAVLLAAGALFAAACSGGGLEDLGPCPTPSLATPAGDGRNALLPYSEVVLTAIDEIDERARSFHRAWPDRELEESGSFREQFNQYTHEATCQSAALRDVEPPISELEDFDTRLDRALAHYVDVMTDGLDAVRTRNESGFDRWDRREGGAVADIRELGDELEDLVREVLDN